MPKGARLRSLAGEHRVRARCAARHVLAHGQPGGALAARVRRPQATLLARAGRRRGGCQRQRAAAVLREHALPLLAGRLGQLQLRLQALRAARQASKSLLTRQRCSGAARECPLLSLAALAGCSCCSGLGVGRAERQRPWQLRLEVAVQAAEGGGERF
jgi:hypothetical protein